VAAGYDVYVFSARFLQQKANSYEFRLRHSASHSVLRNLVVLAIDTAQITAGNKNYPGACFSGYGRLFAEMQTGARDSERICFTAKTALPCRPVYAAISRT
jgi:hypothetical protein